ncbi:MAG TPA: TadE/TadG family type IV pilus assembly protein, partial [Isosphaeraceae bacterium]|nr:TadE/TadG family type IV pilus assembly protein [Isosphaeraceae bacterium]
MAVETALVMTLMTSFVFGIFEYSRLLMNWQLLNNAAREGCRFAIANNTSTTITTQVQTIVTQYMAGQTTSFSNFTVTLSGTHLGVSTAINSLAPGDLVTVTVSGTYNFL